MVLSSISRHPTRLDLHMVTEAGYCTFRPSGDTFLTCCALQERRHVPEFVYYVSCIECIGRTSWCENRCRDSRASGSLRHRDAGHRQPAGRTCCGTYAVRIHSSLGFMASTAAAVPERVVSSSCNIHRYSVHAHVNTLASMNTSSQPKLMTQLGISRHT
jgi:hypothetical protein